MTPDLKNKVEQAIHSYIVGDIVFSTEELYSVVEDLIPLFIESAKFLQQLIGKIEIIEENK